MAANEAFTYQKAGHLSDTLVLNKQAVPDAPVGGVVVRVIAAALNPVDEQLANSSDQLLRLMGMSTGHSKVPGCDFSGIIHSVGKGAKWAIGDEVCGVYMSNTGVGAMQQYLCLPSEAPMCRKPASLSHQEAAAFPLVYSTVHTALVQWGRLALPPLPGQEKRSVLILGGSGGTGTFAIQLAKAMNLKVVTTCSGPNVQLVKELGADEVIDYTKDELVTSALYSAYAPFAVVLDCVGGSDLIPHLKHLLLDDPSSPELGIYITIVGDKTDRSSMGGPVTNVLNPYQAFRAARGAIRDYLPKWVPFKSSIAGPRYRCIMLNPTADQLLSIEDYRRLGGRIIIDSEWAFKDVPKAYAKLESSRAVGKIVVEVSSDRNV